jgi:site-specific DNA-adenine methylase
MILKAPFPWFGGKSRVAHLVWDRFGSVVNYVEPFAGSLAVLLSRPGGAGRNETANDKDAYLANFWLALKSDPEAVAWYADWPVNEVFLHSRHKWLVNQKETLKEKMDSDPDFYDPKIAGWWVWGQSLWIGSGWCAQPEWRGRHACERSGKGINRELDQKRPMLGKGGHGVHQKTIGEQIPRLSGEQGVHRKIPYLDGGGRGIHQNGIPIENPWHIRPDLKGQGITAREFGYDVETWRQRPESKADAALRPEERQGHRGVVDRADLYDYFEALAYRLRKVRVCSGDWARIVGPSPTTEIGLTGVFLDPPYSVPDRDAVYNEDSRDVAIEVRNWALEHAQYPKLRIAVCGYASEHEEFFPSDWEAIAWKANGGYANQSEKTRGRVNATRETIWFSPNCLRTTLFTQEHYEPLFSEEKDCFIDDTTGQ